MLSRVANSVYWMSRYLERADNVARYIDVNIHLILDAQLNEHDAKWWPFVEATADEATFTKKYKKADQKNVIKFLTFDEENPNSIYASMQSARENARSSREVISTEMWEQINTEYHWISRHLNKTTSITLQKFYKTMRNMHYRLLGITDNTMTHNQAWHFVRLGRYLERADKTSRLLGMQFSQLLPESPKIDLGYSSIEWAALLHSADAYTMYRKKYHRVLSRNVIDFLMFDKDFPRSVKFCIRKAKESLEHIADDLQFYTPAHSKIDQLVKLVNDTDINHVLSQGVDEFSDKIQFDINKLDDAIQRSYFGHISPKKKKKTLKVQEA